MQVGFHELKHQVKVLLVSRFNDAKQFDDILMVQAVQHFNLPVSPLSINRVSKSIEYFFKCKYLIRPFLLDFPYVTVGAATHFSNEVVVP